ncbi:MAG TPA: tRNA uridine-5-carboxymethylaminomethyl(34) synthesis enzyme MnmG [Candidatus Deferrimicrobium sp.]|nr:tRNA uridine-5-carboxymethylaminomethyl(34) synthesis enzyme MnmG [Candidatus Deferrimicrobium sp.]
MNDHDFDIIIIGGGHAGVEAALAAARMGKAVCIVTMDATRLALMSCNPAVGGIGKSHVVKEVDALGGLMGVATDASGIQFRRLNLSRGPAVWSTRAQVDRIKYNQFVSEYVSIHSKVTVMQGTAARIITQNGKAVGIGIETGEELRAGAVIIASGTFLGGLMHIGEKQIQGGRFGEKGAHSLSKSLLALGFEVGRLKTGTPPRLDGDTIEWLRCQRQDGEEPIPFFSYRSPNRPVDQVPCYLTKTTRRTKEIILANLHRSPMFSGQIRSIGPRYCPSIEDKFHRFADKEHHQLFLEPEGNGTSEIYPNGFSTSLPEEIQLEAIRSVIGLEEVRMTRPGYAVEYDYCPAYQIKPSLETKRVRGLFFAGQINGTSGYEEAAGQGIMAGINAALYADNQPPFILDRSEAYIGVMIDDLVTRSTTEPYRLFTSRAEYRLALREDNARDRLASYAERYGLISSDDYRQFESLREETERAVSRLKRIRVRVADLGSLAERFKRIDTVSLDNLLRQPQVTLEEAIPMIARFDGDITENRQALERAVIVIKYKGYIDKQQREIDKFKRMESVEIPENFSFVSIRGLRQEALDKFVRFRPSSLGQAGRIEGITPGDVAVLSVYLKRHQRSTA